MTFQKHALRAAEVFVAMAWPQFPGSGVLYTRSELRVCKPAESSFTFIRVKVVAPVLSLAAASLSDARRFSYSYSTPSRRRSFPPGHFVLEELLPPDEARSLLFPLLVHDRVRLHAVGIASFYESDGLFIGCIRIVSRSFVFVGLYFTRGLSIGGGGRSECNLRL